MKLPKYLFPVLIAFLGTQVLAASDSLFTPSALRSFGDYLFQEQDYLRAALEYERYLFLSQEQNDTVLFKIGLCHQLRVRSDQAIGAFRRILELCPGSSLTAPARLAIRYNYYLAQNQEALDTLDYQDDAEFFYKYWAQVNREPGSVTADFFSGVRDDSVRQYLLALEAERQSLKPRSPWLAAGLSVLLPGLGKLYLKRPGDALWACGFTTLAGFITYEAFRSNLAVTGIVTGGMTLSFYLGSIYGSYLAAQVYNRQLHSIWNDKLEKHNPVRVNPYWESWLSAD